MHCLPTRTQSREDGVAFVGVVIMLVLGLAMTGALITFVNDNARDAIYHDEDVVTEYMAVAALNRAIKEVTSDIDADGDGLGALGANAPVTFFDDDGNAIGEYRSIVRFEADCRQVLVAVAAIPDFTNPRAIHSMEAVLESAVEFVLLPTPGAMSISGPVRNPTFPHIGEQRLILSGGDSPAITISDAGGYENIMDELTNHYENGDLDDTNLAGEPGATYTQADGDEFDLPIAHEDTNFLTASELNDYRQALRTYAEDLALDADRVIEGEVHGDQTWGTESNPEVVVIEAKKAGRWDVFDTRGQTIKGHGTLVIKHTLSPNKDLNLDWTGDIFVLGYDGDGDDLLYTFGTHGTINGNLILLGHEDGEASLEMADSSWRNTDLTVNGALLTLAEAESHESEVEAEESSRLTVNGMLGMYGSRIELEVNHADAYLEVNGSLAVGLPADNTRTDDFEFEMEGEVSVTWDQDLALEAVTGLVGLETNTDFADEETNKVITGDGSYNDGIVNPLLVPATMVSYGESVMTDLHALLKDFGQTSDYGVDLDCMPAGVVTE